MHYIGLERKLLTVLEEVKTQVCLNTKLLHAVVRKVDSIGNLAQDEECTIPEMVFPLKTREEVNAFEEKLSNAEYLNNLVCTFII